MTFLKLRGNEKNNTMITLNVEKDILFISKDGSYLKVIDSNNNEYFTTTKFFEMKLLFSEQYNHAFHTLGSRDSMINIHRIKFLDEVHGRVYFTSNPNKHMPSVQIGYEAYDIVRSHIGLTELHKSQGINLLNKSIGGYTYN